MGHAGRGEGAGGAVFDGGADAVPFFGGQPEAVVILLLSWACGVPERRVVIVLGLRAPTEIEAAFQRPG